MLREVTEYSYTDHVTNEDVRRKLQAAIGEDHGQEKAAEMVQRHISISGPFYRT